MLKTHLEAFKRIQVLNTFSCFYQLFFELIVNHPIVDITILQTEQKGSTAGL